MNLLDIYGYQIRQSPILGYSKKYLITTHVHRDTYDLIMTIEFTMLKRMIIFTAQAEKIYSWLGTGRRIRRCLCNRSDGRLHRHTTKNVRNAQITCNAYLYF